MGGRDLSEGESEAGSQGKYKVPNSSDDSGQEEQDKGPVSPSARTNLWGEREFNRLCGGGSNLGPRGREEEHATREE